MHSHQAHMCCVLCFYFKARTRRRIIKLTCQGHARTRALFQLLAIYILIICRHRNKQACGHDQCQMYGVHYVTCSNVAGFLCRSFGCQSRFSREAGAFHLPTLGWRVETRGCFSISEGREVTFFRNSQQGEGRECRKETECGRGLGSWDTIATARLS